jgi:hypothetical protein
MRVGGSDDLPLGVDMDFRESCVEEDELSMMIVTHLSSFRHL